jgi:SAM-dependent methyltransferase
MSIDDPTGTTTLERSTATTSQPPDPEAAAERLVRILDDGAIALLLGLGHQLGLFEVLASVPAATSAEIADAAGLDERYVREWLGGVTTAGLVDYQPQDARYAVVPAYAPNLTGPTPDNLARSMTYISLLGQVTPLVREKFRTGGGLAYSDYPGFHDLQAADSGAVNDAALLDAIIPLTGEIDRLRSGIDVADVGCGEGHVVNLLARAFPASRFTGLDFEQEAVDAAQAEARAWQLDNATFAVSDVANEVPVDAFDLATAFDTVHDQADPARVLAGIRAGLRPGGTFLMADIDASSRLENNLELPWASFLYTISLFHCMSVSLGQGGAGLGAVWGVELAERMLGEAGFTHIEQHRIDQDPINVYVVARV